MNEEVKLNEEKPEEILKQASDSILQEGISISVDIRPKNRIEKLLQKVKVKPVKKVFDVKPLVLGTLVRISKLLLDIDPDILKNEKMLQSGYDLVKKHGETIAEIIALAVTNSRSKPPKSLREFFLYNLTSGELLSVLLVVMRQMSVRSFTLSIVLTAGLNVQENPDANAKNADKTSQVPGGIIAFGG